jgi:hypothetical protein
MNLEFQFYSSAIKTRLLSDSNQPDWNFNSIVVRLRLLLLRLIRNCKSYFNSIVVRLRPDNDVRQGINRVKFQFYSSAIKTKLLWHFVLFRFNFNSIVVRLRLKMFTF